MKLENQYLLVEASEDGAEITKIYNKEDGTDIIWEGNPKFWKRHSPVLFPNVGKTYNNKMLINGKVYSTSQHGFARDSVFECVESTDSMVSFLLTSSEETKKKYPFDFCLSIGYRLEGRTVKIIWRVENTNKKTMDFSIGGHPAFVCPIRGLGKQTDYRIRFDTAGPIVSSLIGEGGLLTEEKVNYVLEHQELQIVEDLFAKDALVMEHDQAHEVSLIAPDGNPYVTVAFEAPLFGIWAPKGGKAPFVCIEPWYGRCDRTNFQKKLEEREWGNTLASGESFEASYTITLG